MDEVRSQNGVSSSVAGPPAVGSGCLFCAAHSEVSAVARCLACARLVCEQCRESREGHSCPHPDRWTFVIPFPGLPPIRTASPHEVT